MIRRDSPITGKRLSGILLHPSSLPGPFGIGDIGPEAHRFIDQLHRAKQRVWQMLPLGPTIEPEYHSPYSTLSAFGANPILISPEQLYKDGYLSKESLKAARLELGNDSPTKVNFQRVERVKRGLLREAFASTPGRKQIDRVQNMLQREKWSRHLAEFTTLYARFAKPRPQWPFEYRVRLPAVAKELEARCREEVLRHGFTQLIFRDQWSALRAHAKSRDVALIGDIPIYVSDTSADVWASPEYFELTKDRRTRLISGVPPDNFSKTGQLWGHPVFNWRALERDKFHWWVERMRVLLEYCDVARIDHFRGFESFWAVDGNATTAQIGAWLPCPGHELLETIRARVGGLPVIAEDLGVITPEVVALRERFNLPSMKILQFGFDSKGTIRDNVYAPFHYTKNEAVYTGTHDNPTAREWYRKLGKARQTRLRRYLGWPSEREVVFEFIRLAQSTVSDLCVIPLQDVMDLDTEARMNFPSTVSWKNWSYRFKKISEQKLAKLGELTETFERVDRIWNGGVKARWEKAA